MPLAVSRSALNHRQVARDPRFLRRLRNVADVRPKGDDGFPRTPGRDPRGGNAEDALADREAVAAQHVDEVAGRFRLLEPKLAVAEDLIDHLLGELGVAGDVLDGFLLERGETGGGGGSGGGGVRGGPNPRHARGPRRARGPPSRGGGGGG